MPISLIERLEEIARAEERSIRAFELKIGVSSGYLATIKKKSGNVGVQTILKVVEIYPNWALNWIMIGQGLKTTIENGEDLSGNFSEDHQAIKNSLETLSSKIDSRFTGLERGLTQLLLDTASIKLKSDKVDVEIVNKAIRSLGDESGEL